MAPSVASSTAGSSRTALTWRPTTIMNMKDLSRDDDFLSHLLVEKIGTGVVPLLVHKMDPTRRLPKTKADALMEIVRRFVTSRFAAHSAIRVAVDELLGLNSVRYYLKCYTQKQINAFATHASRYFELYHPSGSIEIAHTSRYSHRTGKSELCILATRPLAPGAVISELKGSMADLTDEEDRELKRTDRRHTDGIRRDFSVIHSKQMKKNHLFLGPARFVNHDCDNNCELFREGKYITFRVIKPIGVGEEVTAHYGYGYFGHKNRHCLCETCEKLGRGGYAPQPAEDELSEYNSDEDSGTSGGSSDEESSKQTTTVNVNERRTRRGVYAILPDKHAGSDSEEEEEEDDEEPSAPPPIQLAVEESRLATPALSRSPSKMSFMGPPSSASALTMMTPDPDVRPPVSSSSLSALSSEASPAKKTPFKSVIATRSQKARQAAAASDAPVPAPEAQLATPPLSEDAHSDVSAKESKRSKEAESASVMPRRSKRFARESDIPSTLASRDTSVVRGRDASAAPSVRDRRKHKSPTPLKGKVKEDPDEVKVIDDGLPRCSTCSSVLPVITVDEQVVWGLGFESPSGKGKGKNKKEEKQDCPRCVYMVACVRIIYLFSLDAYAIWKFTDSHGLCVALGKFSVTCLLHEKKVFLPISLLRRLRTRDSLLSIAS
ncbi:hypothetical protein NEOLEDRAFT_76291 [Neolentinus lepideus HHB14362 ss-1]|uniref:SET domain-containing protein n=1 Tax=Neolentinus lepideus HHB14362 ss-1 TaxID=1314782 RepID=A0A165N1S0_9AGAM|nr:hypothetical protein NEOLEDRAFT_76291 [Neolentinus lepideus HHB14362 ss-1]